MTFWHPLHFSFPPAIRFMITGALGIRLAGVVFFSDHQCCCIYLLWGKLFCRLCWRILMLGGSYVFFEPTEGEADDVLSLVKLFIEKFVTTLSSLRASIATTTAWWHQLFLSKKLQVQKHLPLFWTVNGNCVPLSTRNDCCLKPWRTPLFFSTTRAFFTIQLSKFNFYLESIDAMVSGNKKRGLNFSRL